MLLASTYRIHALELPYPRRKPVTVLSLVLKPDSLIVGVKHSLKIILHLDRNRIPLDPWDP